MNDNFYDLKIGKNFLNNIQKLINHKEKFEKCDEIKIKHCVDSL